MSGAGGTICKQLPTVLEQVSITGYSIKRYHCTSKLNPRHGSLLPGSPGCHPTRSQVLYRPQQLIRPGPGPAGANSPIQKFQHHRMQLFENDEFRENYTKF